MSRITIDGIPVHSSITDETILEMIDDYNSGIMDPGICIACGDSCDGVEPDARRYKCEACGKRAVYGAEELLIHFA